MFFIILPILLLIVILLLNNNTENNEKSNCSKKISTFNKMLKGKNIVMESTSSLELAAYCERLYVESGIKSVQREIKIQSFKAQSPEHARLYEQSSLEVEKRFNEYPATNIPIVIQDPPQFELPHHSYDSIINEKICQRINTMKLRHEEWLLEQFKFLQKNPSTEYKFWDYFDKSGQSPIKENILKLYKDYLLKNNVKY